MWYRVSRLSHSLKKRLIKRTTLIVLLTTILIALTLLPLPAMGDNREDVISAPTREIEAILPQIEPIKDRTTRRVVPQEEKQRIVALITEEIPNAPIMVAIANAESGFDCGIKNSSSSARGCFQIISSTWKSYRCTGDILDPKSNIKCAAKIYADSGTSPWNESKYSWGKYVGKTLQHILQDLKI